MADVVVSEGGDTEGGGVAESAHEAAVAEGASAVLAETAVTASAEAQAAAEIALEAADANISSGQLVEQAVATANESAAVASVSADMVHEALTAQTSAIAALTEELRASRKSAGNGQAPKAAPPSGDRAPAKRGFGHKYYGG